MPDYGYVAVINADNELEARSYVERTLHPEGGTCLMIGGGTLLKDTIYMTGGVADAISEDAFAEDE